MDDRKSASGFVFHIGSGAVFWSSKKQPVIALSTMEAEYMAAALCACQAVWLRHVLEDLHQQQLSPTTIYCDNKSAIALAKKISKHIDIKFHYLRDLVKEGEISLKYCKSHEQVADILTKPLKADLFYKLKQLLGVCNSASLSLREAVGV